jgi:hypothetical protein
LRGEWGNKQKGEQLPWLHTIVAGVSLVHETSALHFLASFKAKQLNYAFAPGQYSRLLQAASKA